MRRSLFVTVLVAGLLAVGLPAAASHSVETNRLSGADRYATAAAIAMASHPEGADTAFIARGDAFPDALAAAPIARQAGGPVLLTRPDEVPDATWDALADLGVDEVVLLGGTSAISEDVGFALEEDHTVSRLFGSDRYGTAAEIALAIQAAQASEVGTLDGLRTAFVASGENFPDALAAGAPASAQDDPFPVLLTRTNTLPDDTAQVLGELDIEQAVIVGGERAVSADVAEALGELGITIQRLRGPDRQATAAAVADFMIANTDATGEHTVLARGDDFPDALTAGPYAGATLAPILLSGSPGALGNGEEWFDQACLLVREITAVGGTAAVSDDVLSAAAGAVENCHGTWGALPDGPVEHRNNHTATWTGDRLLVWGGEVPPDEVTNDGAAWDPDNREWRALPEAPIQARWLHDAAWTGDELLVWGGSPGVGDQACLTDGALYDPETGEWRTMTELPGGPRCAAATAWTGDAFIVFGGHGAEGIPGPGDALDDGYAYDPAADEWTELAPAPLSARFGAVATWTGDALIVFGGTETPDDADAPLEHQVDGAIYDPATDAWEAMDAAPLAPRGDFEQVWIGDELLVFGGTNGGDDPAERLTDAAAYDPATDMWRELADLPGPQEVPAVAWTGSVVYVLGGDRSAPDAPVFVAYDPDADEWSVRPEAPGGPRAFHTAEWTGQELLVWGGDGADDADLPAGLTWRPPS